MKKIGILRSNINLGHMSNITKSIGVESPYYSMTFISHATGELKVGELLKIGDKECKVLHLGKYLREYECLTGKPVPGDRQFEIATSLNPELAEELIGEEVFLLSDNDKSEGTHHE